MDSQAVNFATGSGTLKLDSPSSFTGTVSGIAGAGDILDLNGFSAATTTAQTGGGSYNGTTTALTDSADSVSATIDLVGNYSTSGWSVTSDGNGGIDVVDPPPIAVNDGALVEIAAASAGAVMFGGTSGTLQLDNSQSFSGQIAGFGGQDQIDLRDIAASANATIGYAATSDNSGGTLTVSDGTHSANIALLGQYAAGSFAAAGDAHGGSAITKFVLAAQDQLAHPHA